MFELTIGYTDCVQNCEREGWKLDEVMSTGQALAFELPFLPPSLTKTACSDVLLDAEQLLLNHITSNAYLHLFGLLDGCLQPVALAHARERCQLDGDAARVRALMKYADEKGKHQQLFHRYNMAFERDFSHVRGHSCRLVNMDHGIVDFIHNRSALATLLIRLHLELAAQKHHIACVAAEHDIDVFFASLLNLHWLDEAQHAQLDALELGKLAPQASRHDIERAFAEYFATVSILAEMLDLQAEMDLVTLMEATGRQFTVPAQRDIVASQTRTYWHLFLAGGMLHRDFLHICGQLSTSAPWRIGNWISENYHHTDQLVV